MKQATGTTNNGAPTFETSGSACVDFFFNAGAYRNKDITPLFLAAASEDLDTAIRIALWMRDARGGAGERQSFRTVLAATETHYPALVSRLLDKMPELGRWDDVLTVRKLRNFRHAGKMISRALAGGNGLCAKWMPRKGRDFTRVKNFLKLDSKGYRKLIVGLSNTVETTMSSNKWGNIVYKQVPSLSMVRYKNAFKKHDGYRYSTYLSNVGAGIEKMNTASMMPHHIIQNYMQSGWAGDVTKPYDEALEVMWKELEVEIGGNALSIIDTSGSMLSIVSGSVRCIDVSVGLGIYTATSVKGPFNNKFITFSENPELLDLSDRHNLKDKIESVMKTKWGMSTNISRVFNLILAEAVDKNLHQGDLPEKLIIYSDMEFDSCMRGTDNTAYQNAKNKFSEHGYELPQVVFWQLNGRQGNSPVTLTDSGTALVSGFSPSLLELILKTKRITPMVIMKKAISNKRYDY